MTNKKSDTCLIVLRDAKGKLIFGADRRVSWGVYRYQESARSKLTKRNGILLSGTGTCCVCDIVTDLCVIPKIPENMDGFTYVHTLLFDSVKNTLRSKGYLDKEDNIKLTKELNGFILIGVKGELFELGITKDGITTDAIQAPYTHGCGGTYAMGSLESTKGDSLQNLKNKVKTRKIRGKFKSVEELRIALAIDVAATHSAGCDSRVDIEKED